MPMRETMRRTDVLRLCRIRDHPQFSDPPVGSEPQTRSEVKSGRTWEHNLLMISRVVADRSMGTALSHKMPRKERLRLLRSSRGGKGLMRSALLSRVLS